MYHTTKKAIENKLYVPSVMMQVKLNTKRSSVMKNSLLVHKHLIIRAEAVRPPTDEEQLQEWMRGFIESINMKVFMGPYVKYCNMPGNRGITAIAIIETSHIAMHIWDEPKPALMQMDVYSCGDFSPTDICNKLMKDFDIHKIEYKYLNRETGLVDL